jgi:hypothetical protein
MSLGAVLLTCNAIVPCYIAIAACYVSQVICEVDRTFLTSSLTPVCRLASAAHSPEQLFHIHHDTCPTSLLWTVKPSFNRLLGKFWTSTAVAVNRNYASLGGGARIIRGYTSPTHNLPPPSFSGSLIQSLFGYNPQYANVKSAGIVLEEDTSVGECWCLSGASGHVAIQLSEMVFISHISVDYASPRLLSQQDISRAPQNMSLWVLFPLADAERPPNTQMRLVKEFKLKRDRDANFPPASRFIQVLDFQYNIQKPPTRQIFSLPFRMPSPSQTIIMEIKSNEGAPITCLYWLGIHGMRGIGSEAS